MSAMLDALLTPQQRAQADAAEAAMRVIDSQRAIRATLNSAGQAINAALRPCFDREYGVYPGLCGDLRAEVEAEETLTAEQAHDEATDQILSFAESVADWMAKACDCEEGRLPLDVSALEPLQIIEGLPALLVAVLMNGDNSQVLRAVYRLREMAAKNFAAEIDERAAELLAAAL
jgi:hypothetical protein